MPSIRKEIAVEASADHVWSAIRELGSVHTRLARGFVLDTRLDGDSRLVTFANGITVRERIIDLDDAARRFAYSVVEWLILLKKARGQAARGRNLEFDRSHSL